MNRTPFVIALLASISGAQTTWYVDVGATAPGSGTQASPFKRIQYAISQPTTVDGDTLLVAPGTYVENIQTNLKRITLRSSHGPEVTQIKAAVAGPVITLGNLNTVGGPPTVLEGFAVTGLIALNNNDAAVRSFSGIVRRCTVYDNHGLPGVGIDVLYDTWIYDCVITRNTSGLRISGSSSELHDLRDSIVWGNDYDIYSLAGAPLAEYCAGLAHVSPPLIGAHNVFADPRMWDPEHGNFRLAPGSPCIDAGDPNAPHDPDGSLRDIGPFAYEAGYSPPPTVYCFAKTNSLGCVPSIGSTGQASATAATPFTITCTNELNNKLGVMFYGYIQTVQPWEGGWFCIWPFHRTPAIYSQGNAGIEDCSGVFACDFNAHIQSGLDAGLVVGEVVYAQFWSRDPHSSFTTNRSDALSFGIAP